jgi:hypothetical protein
MCLYLSVPTWPFGVVNVVPFCVAVSAPAGVSESLVVVMVLADAGAVMISVERMIAESTPGTATAVVDDEDEDSIIFVVFYLHRTSECSGVGTRWIGE